MESDVKTQKGRPRLRRRTSKGAIAMTTQDFHEPIFVWHERKSDYLRKIFSIAFPFASSSISLSR
jgi:hypothetical protein